jgi:adenine/guanine phosphoribosyltransferase-like PRPP-binding protein
MSFYLDFIGDSEQLKKVTDATAKYIKKLHRKLKFDAIVVTGLSGAGVGFPVSYKTGLPVIYIRKSRVYTHGEDIEGIVGNLKNKRLLKYIILDDLIGTGKTVKKIMRKMQKEIRSECVGILLYCYGSDHCGEEDNPPVYEVMYS